MSASPVMKRVGTLTEQPAHCEGCWATATLMSKASIAVALEAVPIVAPPPMECPTTAVPALRLMCAESLSLPSAHASAARAPASVRGCARQKVETGAYRGSGRWIRAHYALQASLATTV